MGTRAIITIEGKPVIATHWDGYPDSLGEDLKEMPDLTIESILKVAEKHSVDFMEKSIGEKVMLDRIKALAKKHNLSIAEIKAGKRRGNLFR